MFNSTWFRLVTFTLSLERIQISNPVKKYTCQSEENMCIAIQYIIINFLHCMPWEFHCPMSYARQRVIAKAKHIRIYLKRMFME